jgi:hypothetical protein
MDIDNRPAIRIVYASVQTAGRGTIMVASREVARRWSMPWRALIQATPDVFTGGPGE